MTNLNIKRKWLLVLLCFALVALSTLGLGAFSARQRPEDQLRKDWLTSAPRVKSKVKDLEIINPRILAQGTELASVAFQIHNKSARPVMAVRIGSGNASISKDGLEDEDNPQVIIQPYGIIDAEMFDLTKGAPLVILSATFKDVQNTKEEGDSRSLQLTKKLRERAKRLKAEKGNHPLDWRPNQ